MPLDRSAEFAVVTGQIERTEVFCKPFTEPWRQIRHDALHQQVRKFMVDGFELLSAAGRRQRDVVDVAATQEVSAHFYRLALEPWKKRFVRLFVPEDEHDHGRAWGLIGEDREDSRDGFTELFEAKGDVPDVSRACVANQKEVWVAKRDPSRSVGGTGGDPQTT